MVLVVEVVEYKTHVNSSQIRWSEISISLVAEVMVRAHSFPIDNFAAPILEGVSEFTFVIKGGIFVNKIIV